MHDRGSNKEGDRLNTTKLLLRFDRHWRACPARAWFNPSVCGATAMRMHEFGRVRQRLRTGKSAGHKDAFERRLYVHVFYSRDNDTKKEVAFRKELLELKAQVENGVEEFTQSAQCKIERNLVCSKKGRVRAFKVGFNDQEIAPTRVRFNLYRGLRIDDDSQRFRVGISQCVYFPDVFEDGVCFGRFFSTIVFWTLRRRYC